MGSRFPSKTKTRRWVTGYDRGFWLLVVASSLMIAMMVMMESSRARPLGFGLGRQIEMESLPAEEARSLGITISNKKKKI